MGRRYSLHDIWCLCECLCLEDKTRLPGHCVVRRWIPIVPLSTQRNYWAPVIRLGKQDKMLEAYLLCTSIHPRRERGWWGEAMLRKPGKAPVCSLCYRKKRHVTSLNPKKSLYLYQGHGKWANVVYTSSWMSKRAEIAKTKKYFTKNKCCNRDFQSERQISARTWGKVSNNFCPRVGSEEKGRLFEAVVPTKKN